MKISVVVTTFNGSEYILEQLISIKNQTLLPDEVLIFDDNSSDNTFNIICDFINSNHLKNWKLSLNESRKGWRRNFWDGFEKASYDLIFSCDQDDIWIESKIEKMVSCISENDKIQLLASGYVPFYVDNKTRKIAKKTLKSMKEANYIRKIEFDKFFYIVRRPGCTYCFKKELFKKASVLWCDNFAHDQTLWVMAILVNGLYILENNLIHYRRHMKSATNPIRYKNNHISGIMSDSIYLYKARLNVLRNTNKLLNRAKQYIDSNIKENNYIVVLEKLIKFNELRLQMFYDKNLLLLIVLQLKYQGYYFSLNNKLLDIYIIIGSILYKKHITTNS